MTLSEVLQELESYGDERTKNTWLRHGAQEPIWGVKVGDMKKIVKKIKRDHDLSLALYDTGNGDAMYFAGLIADEEKITKAQLNKWVKKAHWHMIAEYTVPWIAAESNHGWELALDWIESDKENIASAGWSTLSSLMSIMEDEDLDIKLLDQLLDLVGNTIHEQPNRVKYTMNNFVIAAGSYVPALNKKAKKIADQIGKVHVEMEGTACKVPDARPYIEKVENTGRMGQKRKMARC